MDVKTAFGTVDRRSSGGVTNLGSRDRFGEFGWVDERLEVFTGDREGVRAVEVFVAGEFGSEGVIGVFSVWVVEFVDSEVDVVAFVRHICITPEDAGMCLRPL